MMRGVFRSWIDRSRRIPQERRAAKPETHREFQSERVWFGGPAIARLPPRGNIFSC
jgi:hypothetical protein